MTSSTTPILNCIPDDEDSRDFRMEFDTPSRLSRLFSVSSTQPTPPPTVDLRRLCPVAENQGNIGSCVAFATAGVHEMKQRYEKKDIPIVLSKLFIYYEARRAINAVHEDAGSRIRDGMRILGSIGSPPQHHYPYDTTKWKDEPPAYLYNLAKLNVARLYARVAKNQQQIEACLFSGHPIAFGLLLYDGFFDPNGVRKTGTQRLPNLKKENKRGGHAMTLVGYDRPKRFFLVKNSWGTQWGHSGFAWISYDYILHPSLSYDFWTIKLVGDTQSGNDRIIIPT